MEALNLNYESEVFADTSQMSREEWLNTRRFGIGGSEASIIMGVSPFATKRANRSGRRELGGKGCGQQTGRISCHDLCKKDGIFSLSG